MGGRLFDWLGAGDAVNRPAAASMAALLTQRGVGLYFALDTKILSLYDDNDIAWFDIDITAVSALSFETLPDVDWSTPPTDGQIFEWDTASSKLIPVNKPLAGHTTEEIQDIVGAMGINGTGTTYVYDDGAGTFTFNCTITQYTDELAQDAVGAAFAAGTHVGIIIVYDDVGNAFDVEVIPSSVADIHEGVETDKFINPATLIESMEPVAVAYAATIALDLDTGFNFDIATLTGDLLLDDFTNAKEGQSGVIWVKQDGTGGRDVTFGTDWRFPGGAAANPVPTNPNDETTIAYICKGGLIYATVSGDFIA